MNIEQLRDCCLAKKAAQESFPFDETTLVFKVMNKMFAALPLNKPDYIILKCDPDKAIELREQYGGIEPGYHFNKKHWNGIFINSDVPPSLIYELIDHSYNEVVKKLTRKEREALAESE